MSLKNSKLKALHSRFPLIYNSQTPITLPSNPSEIILSTLSNIDIPSEVQKDIESKIKTEESNHFSYYNYNQNFEKTEKTKDNPILSKKLNFKSIHDLGEVSHNRNIVAKIMKKPIYSELEKTIKNNLKKNPKSLILLNELYQDLDEEKQIETVSKTEIDLPIVSNLEKWIVKSRHSIKNNSLPHILNTKINRVRKETQDDNDLIEEQTFKKYNLDNLGKKGKAMTKEDLEIQDFLNKMPKVNKVAAVFFGGENEEGIRFEENTENFILSLKKNTKSILRAQLQGNTIEEKSEYFEKQVNLIEEKTMQKIKNLEALLVTKERNSQLIRKENLHILERIKNIKELILQLNGDQEKTNDKILNHKAVPKKNIPQQRNNIALTENVSQVISNIVDINNKENELKKIQNHLNSLKESQNQHYKKMEFNNLMIEELEKNKKFVKIDIKKIYQIRKKFFIKLLKTGKDFRNCGLSWLIKKLWQMGEKISEAELPDYLDQKAKEFLLNKARKELNISEYELFCKIAVEILKSNIVGDKKREGIYEQDRLSLSPRNNNNNDTNNKIKSSKKKNTNSMNENNFMDTIEMELKQAWEQSAISKNNGNKFEIKVKEIIYKNLGRELYTFNKDSIYNISYNNIKEKIKQLIKPDYSKENSKESTHFDELASLTFNMNYSQELNHSLTLYENETKMNNFHTREIFLKDVESLQKKIVETIKQIEISQKIEIHRIIKEFDFRNYRKRFNTEPDVVISSLIGVKLALKQLTRYGMNKKI